MSKLRFVQPLQGTASGYHFSEGNTLPLIARPWGQAAWSPQSDESGAGWFFHPGHRRFEGIRLTHQPSPWIRDYAPLVLMPQTDELVLAAADRSASYRPEQLELQPHRLQVELPRYDIMLELAPAMRSAILRATFRREEGARWLIAPCPGASSIAIDPVRRCITGSTSAHFGEVHPSFAMHYVITLDCAIDEAQSGVFTQDGQVLPVQAGAGDGLGAYVGVLPPPGGVVELRIATSFISAEQALLNLERELAGHGLDSLQAEAAEAWEDVLDRIEIETADARTSATFYSCMYRLCLFPRTMHEYDTDDRRIHYSPYDGQVHEGPMYADVGFWDIYRTTLPLYSLLFPERLAEMTEAWVNIYRESGWMPKWISPAERSAMPGTLIDAAIADAYVKGIRGFDVKTAYEGLRKHAMERAEDGRYGRPGLDDYAALGYLPSDRYHESVSNALDYYYGDFCIAQLARALGKTEDYERFLARSRNYALLFDQESGFMRPRDAAGAFEPEFDELAWGGAYCEGSAWQCSWAVPHDIAGLAELMGGRERMLAKLDRLFTMPPLFKAGAYRAEIHEMSEMAAIDYGQFAISNQPSFHLPYMYAVLGERHRTQTWIDRTTRELFSAERFPGDEDNGSMSAWYIWSMLGLYPFTPGVPQYLLLAPQVKRATIRLENGQTIELTGPDRTAEEPYLGEVRLNGERYSSLYIHHDELARGARLEYARSAHPERAAKLPKQLPYSLTREEADE